MRFQSTLTLTALSAAIATVLSVGTASAQQPEPEQPPPPPQFQPAPQPQPVMQPQPQPQPERKKDGVRFRGGIALEGGGMLVPGIINLGLAGVQGQLGAQINNSFGVYAVPSFQIVFGGLGGLQVGAAVLVDYTFLDDILTVGVGPDVASFVAFGGTASSGDLSVTAAAGSFYGARLHFAVNPVVDIGANGIRRKSLTIGVDMRLYSGGAAFATSGTNGVAAAVTDFVAEPTLSIGYQAF